jgi:DNA-binding SARP family transcriptional activator
MEVRVLGPVVVVDDEGVELLLSLQLRRLLELLVVADGRVVSADRIADYVAERERRGVDGANSGVAPAEGVG